MHPLRTNSRLSLFAALLGVLASQALIAGEPASKVWSQRQGNETFFAFGVKAPHVDMREPTPVDLTIVVDTTASQTGQYRQRALSMVREVLANCSEKDRVRLFALDVKLESLMPELAAVNHLETKNAVARLSERIPLGSTNLEQGLTQALQTVPDFEEGRQTGLLYIGDGMSAAHLVSSEELHQFINTAIGRRTPVHCYVVGRKIDLTLPGVLAQQTGGLVVADGASAAQLGQTGEEPAIAAKIFSTGISQRVIYGSRLKATDSNVELMMTSAPPLRMDRETIVLGKLSGTADNVEVVQSVLGQTRNLSLNLKSSATVSCLLSLWNSGKADEGWALPLAGVHQLEMVQRAHMKQAEYLVQVSEDALKAKDIDQARQAVDALRQVAPEHKRLAALTVAMQKEGAPSRKENKEDDTDDKKNASAPRPGTNLQAEESRREVAGQQMTAEVTNKIEFARKLVKSDADAALDVIKRQITTVLSSQDINPEIRNQLRDRLVLVWRELMSKRDVMIAEEAQRQSRIAALEAQRRLVDKRQLDDERINQLIDRSQALMEEGFHGNANAFEEAEGVARTAVLMEPDMKEPAAALFDAEAAGQLDKSFRLRQARNDKFLEALHQAELAHIPFPDEPPFLYPPVEVWRQIYEERVVRKKWASMDLRRYSKKELEIQNVLDKELDFPLNLTEESVQNAIETLRNRITPRIDIIPDKKALDEESISLDTLTVNLNVSGIKVKVALKLILQDHNLTYVIEDEVLKITTQTAARKKRVIRVYSVADLVIPIRSGGGGGQAGGGGFGGGGQGGFGGGGGIGGGGFGGGGGASAFNIPDEPLMMMPAKPAANNKLQKNDKPAPKGPAPADKQADQVLKNLLGSRLDNRTKGQSFAQVHDEPTRELNLGKKKPAL